MGEFSCRLLAHYRRSTYPRSRPQHESIRYPNFHQAQDHISIRLVPKFRSCRNQQCHDTSLVLSAKMRRNKRLIWQTLDFGNIFGLNFDLKNPQYFHFTIQNHQIKILVLVILIFLHAKYLYHLILLAIHAQNLFSDWIWAHVLQNLEITKHLQIMKD